MFAGIAIAQEKPKNVSEETTVKTTKTNDGSKITESKVKVTTREEQNIEFEEGDKNKTDKDIIETPVKVTNTLEVDNDKDQYYDSKVEISHYEYDGHKYNFSKDENGFLITTDANDNTLNIGNAIRASRENHYLFRDENRTGVGYFNKEGNFAVEYYNPNTGTLEKEVFILVK